MYSENITNTSNTVSSAIECINDASQPAPGSISRPVSSAVDQQTPITGNTLSSSPSGIAADVLDIRRNPSVVSDLSHLW